MKYSHETPQQVARAFKKSKNLPEIFYMYPNNGVSFKVWQRDWSPDKYYKITDVQFINNREAKILGILYEKGFRKSPYP